MDVIYKVLVIEIGSMDFIIDFLVNICLIYNGVYKYYYVVGVYQFYYGFEDILCC